MLARERTSTGCSAQGELRLQHLCPNEYPAMSAKPVTQNAGPTLAIIQFAHKQQVGTTLATGNLAPTGHPKATPAVTAVQPTLLRLPMVMRITGLARSTIYKLISQNQFPVPVKLSARAVAWLQSEIDNWVSSRVRAH